MTNENNGRNGRPMTEEEYRRRQAARRARRKRRQRQRIMVLCAMAVALVGTILLVVWGVRALRGNDEPGSSSLPQSESPAQSLPPESVPESTPESDSVPESIPASVPAATVDKSDWKLILANKNCPLPDGYDDTLELGDVDHGHRLQAEAAEAFNRMRDAANANGLTLMACSSYRSVGRQTELFNAQLDKVKRNNPGLTDEEAREKAATVVMYPGRSEHNTGLAVDVGSATNQRIEEDFENEPEFAWLQEHAAEYGFVMRYPKDKQAITGVIYEPWHYRYVGVENAGKMNELGLCLEEYLEQ